MLSWNVLLAPHHCSKKAMYERDADGNDVLQEDIMQELAKCQLSPGYIVASSPEFPGKNSSGDNPPHRKARNRYEEIVNDQFVCTGEVSTAGGSPTDYFLGDSSGNGASWCGLSAVRDRREVIGGSDSTRAWSCGTTFDQSGFRRGCCLRGKFGRSSNYVT